MGQEAVDGSLPAALQPLWCGIVVIQRLRDGAHTKHLLSCGSGGDDISSLTAPPEEERTVKRRRWKRDGMLAMLITVTHLKQPVSVLTVIHRTLEV